jgi:hypothetical protein
MNDKKLTPRVGDRVLVKTGAFTGVVTTYAANVIHVNASGDVHIHVPEVQESGWWDVSDLTVVDRQPVEWPEGWSRFSSSMVAHRNQRTFSRAELEDITQAGPDMLARWDELMGGDA